MPTPLNAAPLPQPAHVVVVVEENKSIYDIEGNVHAPYINGLMKRGALFTNSHGVMHPSLPNYLALFAGVTNDNGDGCPAHGISPSAPNLSSELRAAHRSFTGYAQAQPQTGFRGCWAGTYARKHVPWTEFTNVPDSEILPFAALRSYDSLPTVAFLIPDVNNDMHDGSIAQGDAWLARNLAPLLRWADAHNTLVILTWDEGFDNANTIPTVFVGPMVRAGRYGELVDHFRVLRTIEDFYGLPALGRSAQRAPIADTWKP